MRARLKEGTGDDLGKQFLELYSTAVGISAEITVDASSTGEGTVGIATTTATGSAATWIPTYSNIEYTFPSGTYTAGHVYAHDLTGPRASVSAITDAMTAAHDEYPNKPFGYFVIAQEASDASNCRALRSACAALCDEWKADTDAPVFADFAINAQYHNASSDLATNDANIASARAALITAFTGDSASIVSNVAFSDVYLDGSPELHAGSFRRPASVYWAWATGAHLFSRDPGDGSYEPATGSSLLAPDGLTRAADDTRGQSKLGGRQGPGFAALRSRGGDLGAVGFKPGATRAGSNSRYVYRGRVATAFSLARVLWPAADALNGQSFETDPLTGSLADEAKDQIESDLQALADGVWKPNDTMRHASKVTVTVDNSGIFQNDGAIPIDVEIVPLGVVENVAITFRMAGTVTFQEA